MAIVRAFKATDIRNDIIDGIVVSASRTSIVVTDGKGAGEFQGNFFFPFAPAVGGSFTANGNDFIPLAFSGLASPAFFELNAVGGTLTGYEQREGFLRQFSISDFSIDARLALNAAEFDDPALFNRLIFAGRDTMFGSNKADVFLGYTGGDKLLGYDGNDILKGNQGNDVIYGGNGRDAISGGSGWDRLFGGDGHDRIKAGKGNDFIHGQDGADQISGGRGLDTQWGDGGSDTFRFDSTADSKPGSGHRDVIRDFGKGDDLVDVSRIDANENKNGNQSFAFIGDAAFSDKAGELRYDSGKHRLEGDTTGDGDADFEVGFKNDAILTAGDIIL